MYQLTLWLILSSSSCLPCNRPEFDSQIQKLKIGIGLPFEAKWKLNFTLPVLFLSILPVSRSWDWKEKTFYFLCIFVWQTVFSIFVNSQLTLLTANIFLSFSNHRSIVFFFFLLLAPFHCLLYYINFFSMCPIQLSFLWRMLVKSIFLSPTSFETFSSSSNTTFRSSLSISSLISLVSKSSNLSVQYSKYSISPASFLVQYQAYCPRMVFSCGMPFWSQQFLTWSVQCNKHPSSILPREALCTKVIRSRNFT